MLDSEHGQTLFARTWEEPCTAPESRLMLAVLQDALATFQRGLGSTVGKELESFREVDLWFRSRDYDSPFSFESICSTLGIDADGVREGLNKLRLRAFMNRNSTIRRTHPRERIYTRRAWGNQLG